MEPKEVGKKKSFTEEELTRELDRLMHEQANNQQIKDWVEVWCDCPGDKNNVWSHSFRIKKKPNQLFITYFQSFFFFHSVFLQANLDDAQTSSNQFVRALMTSVCQSAIICKHD